MSTIDLFRNAVTVPSQNSTLHVMSMLGSVHRVFKIVQCVRAVVVCVRQSMCVHNVYNPLLRTRLS